MIPSEPIPVKLICGVLFYNQESLEEVLRELIQKYGVVDYTSETFPFDKTTYYQQEMGSSIFRVFYSFEKLINPKQLAAIKQETNQLEEKFSQEGKRKINLDPGYLDYHKLILASAKYEGHKIYLDFGFYADSTLRYEKGRFYPTIGCFPDFKSGLYEKAFLRIRENYKLQLKKLNSLS